MEGIIRNLAMDIPEAAQFCITHGVWNFEELMKSTRNFWSGRPAFQKTSLLPDTNVVRYKE